MTRSQALCSEPYRPRCLEMCSWLPGEPNSQPKGSSFFKRGPSGTVFTRRTIPASPLGGSLGAGVPTALESGLHGPILSPVTRFPCKPRGPETPFPRLRCTALGEGYWSTWTGNARTPAPLGLPARQALGTVTDEHPCGWRPPTFLGLLEFSGPRREHQSGPDRKFSIIRKGAVFRLLCLWRQQSSGRGPSGLLVAWAMSLKDPVPAPAAHRIPARPLQASESREVWWRSPWQDWSSLRRW